MKHSRPHGTALPSQASPARSRPSLERRLPLLITLLLAATLAVSLGLVYVAVRGSVEEMASEKLQNAAEGLGDLVSSGISQAGRTLAARASAGPIRELLATASAGGAVDSAVVRRALGPFVLQNDPALPVELWTGDGRRVAFLGDAERRPAAGDRNAAVGVLPHEGLDRVPPGDSLVVGSPYVEGTSVFYWAVVPIPGRSGAPDGFVTVQRRIRGGPDLGERLRSLVGEEVSAYYGTLDGRTWLTIAGVPVERPATQGRLVARDTIVGMPAFIELHQPRRVVLAPLRTTFVRLGLLGLAVLALGAVGAWYLSRSITRPLSSLTRAAEALARGDLSSRVAEDGDEELAGLARSFNHMAATVDGSRSELEERVVSTRAMADELAATNVRLTEANAKLQAAMDDARRSGEEADEARQHAEAASRAKSEFLAVMSHELRTPLNAIGGYAELMAMGIRGPVSEEQQRDLERIRTSQAHLLGLISAMLDLSRIESGQVRYDIEPTPLAPFLEGLDALVEPQAAAKSLALAMGVCAVDLAVLADREKLRQILLNLLSNAIRYTPAGGRIRLSARPGRGDGVVAIAVSDTGVGIPPEALAHIFEPFVQLDRSLTQVREGVGLGLAISRDLARAMGGELEVESRVGEGSTFTLTLPAAPPGEAMAPLAMTGEHEVMRG